MKQKDEIDPKDVDYVIQAFRSYRIKIIEEEFRFKVSLNSADQERLVSLVCADLGLAIFN